MAVVSAPTRRPCSSALRSRFASRTMHTSRRAVLALFVIDALIAVLLTCSSPSGHQRATPRSTPPTCWDMLHKPGAGLSAAAAVATALSSVAARAAGSAVGDATIFLPAALAPSPEARRRRAEAPWRRWPSPPRPPTAPPPAGPRACRSTCLSHVSHRRGQPGADSIHQQRPCPCLCERTAR